MMRQLEMGRLRKTAKLTYDTDRSIDATHNEHGPMGEIFYGLHGICAKIHLQK